MKFFVKHLNSVNAIIHQTNLRIYITQRDEVEKINCETDNLRIRRENGLLKQIESVRIFNLQRVF